MVTNALLSAWFGEFNAAVFNGTLTRIPTRLDPYMDTSKAVGLCWGDSIMIAPGQSLEAARCALLHEMVHAWQNQQSLKMTHGKTFKEWKTTCYKIAGLRI